jgi:hypothetical protein
MLIQNHNEDSEICPKRINVLYAVLKLCLKPFKASFEYILLATCLLAGLVNYSSTLKMEAIRSSETSGTTLWTTRRHIPEDDTLQNHCCENLKSYKNLDVPTPFLNHTKFP